MQNEIELKIMLLPENITPIKNWLAQQNVIEIQTNSLGNTYFDTAEQYFAKNQMGFRVRTYNGNYEMTLKMKGEIIGGLHVRPEYNLPLESKDPDFKRLNSHFNLQIPEAEQISEQLVAKFSTDFIRHKWLIQYQNTKIEVALDQGEIKNEIGSAPICELEFELLEGNLNDIFSLLVQMPKRDGMWLSSLSKAQRGYLVGHTERFRAEVEQALSKEKGYILEQKLADYLREVHDPQMVEQFFQVFPLFPHRDKETLQYYLKSAEYLEYNLAQLLASV
ncbi:hypothetical protein AM305_11695 [Actinobacillus minor NM305]|uniref:CYTH domain-containing protein n=1 Tax=Actinobacillus minor NM305 TaxID=637911 RepID=C5S385_9PAST|nr:CYTH domain-containing protein [Actinobacillus minor]EER46545.1 hypothetical protein AM305_11695 [Actinobacillus minor NM305]